MSNTEAVPPADEGPNWDSIKDELAISIVEDLKAFAEGQVVDMQMFAAEISTDMVQALALGRQDLVDEMKGQLKAKGEALRLRASDQVWATINRSITMLSAVVFRLVPPAGA